MRTASTNDRALNSGTAPTAWLTCALIDVQSLLHLTISIWCRVVVDRRATGCDGLAQHADDRMMQRVELGRAQPVRRGEGMDLRTPKCLIGIDIADANDAALVKEEALDARPALRTQHAKSVSGERL